MPVFNERRGGAMVVAAIFLAVLAPPRAAGADGLHSRLYLLAGAERTHNVWSTTPSDPEAAEPAKAVRCEVSPERVSTYPCRAVSTPTSGYHALGFSAGALLPEDITWRGGDVNFHLELEIDAPGEPDVALFVGDNPTAHRATQTTPGVWEGRLGNNGVLSSRANTTLYVGVRTTASMLGLTVRTAGASWLAFATPFAARSGPEVVAISPPPTDTASVFSTAERTFRFHDANWEVRPFTGRHDTRQSIAVPLHRDATALLVYVEGFSEPAAYAAAHGDGRGLSLTEQPRIRVTDADGALLSAGPRGAAVTSVPAGSYTAVIDTPGFWAATTGPPPVSYDYKGYVVIVYGERTLAGMRFPFPPSAVVSFNTAIARNFPPVAEHVPVAAEATTLLPVLVARRISALRDSWAMSFDGHTVSGGAGSGQRLYLSGADVLRFGVTAMEEFQVASQDVKFWLDVSYTYTPLPA